jgi:ABC-type multidrug transport system fused ATPase/permease subunit
MNTIEKLPDQIAGMPLVAQVPFSDYDLEWLNRFVSSRDDKLKRGRFNIIACLVLVLVTIGMLFYSNTQLFLVLLGLGVLLIGEILFLELTMMYRQERELVKQDLLEGYVCRYAGKITDPEHWVVKSGLLRQDLVQSQLIEILPVSK